MKRATVVEVRPTRPDDGVFLASCAWVAVDSAGRKFGEETEAKARAWAEQYNQPAGRRAVNPSSH